MSINDYVLVHEKYWFKFTKNQSEFIHNGGKLKDYDTSHEVDIECLKKVLIIFINTHYKHLELRRLVHDKYIKACGL